MSLDEMVKPLVSDFKSDKRNKVFVPENILITSILEENGKEIDLEELRQIIKKYLDGELDSESQDIYDAAIYSCSLVARLCFADDPEDEDAEVDYEISWLEDDNGSYSAEIRPQ